MQHHTASPTTTPVARPAKGAAGRTEGATAMPVREMTPAEFAVTRQRLGLSLTEVARVLGINERAVRRWVQDDPRGPGQESAEALRQMLSDQQERVRVEFERLRRRKTRPIELLRHGKQDRLEAAGSPHATVSAQDAFLAELTMRLQLEGIDFVVVGDEQ